MSSDGPVIWSAHGSDFSNLHMVRLVSFNKLKDVIGVANATTVNDYLRYLENSYLFFALPRFEYSVKKQSYAPKKVYCVDIRLAREVGFRFSADLGHDFENLVFLELKRRGKDVFYHFGEKECDFVVREGLKIVQTIQVSTSLENKATREREMAGLMDAVVTYGLKEGLILTENEEGEEVVKIGRKTVHVRVIPIWKWLLEW